MAKKETPMGDFRSVKVVVPGLAAVVLAILATAGANAANPHPGGQVYIPASTLEDPNGIGINAHTNFRMFVPTGGLDSMRPPSPSSHAAPETGGPPASGYLFETPASLACVYNLVAAVVAGCDPNSVAANPTGGGRAIAIVDAYHYPTAANDLRVFSAQFGLPLPTAANFQVAFASGRQPAVNTDWYLEEALDIEWAHAMAPQAKLYLVEAASNSFGDLLSAVWAAGALVKAAGGGEVSMSWGGSEFPGEIGADSYFTQTGVVYFAAAGDGPGVIWPAASPSVVAVGGTSLSRNLATGAFQLEVSWQSGGGGPSQYESRPVFQNSIAATAGSHRATPDIAAVADPSTGVWVYDDPYWYIVGGTSVATPVWAGIVNAAGHFAATSQAELTTLYANSSSVADFRDITAETCGPNEGYLVGTGWDFCTGIGVPKGLGGK
jgi:kumamolisin